jgi:hypothetical protein
MGTTVARQPLRIPRRRVGILTPIRDTEGNVFGTFTLAERESDKCRRVLALRQNGSSGQSTAIPYCRIIVWLHLSRMEAAGNRPRFRIGTLFCVCIYVYDNCDPNADSWVQIDWTTAHTRTTALSSLPSRVRSGSQRRRLKSSGSVTILFFARPGSPEIRKAVRSELTRKLRRWGLFETADSGQCKQTQFRRALGEDHFAWAESGPGGP